MKTLKVEFRDKVMTAPRWNTTTNTEETITFSFIEALKGNVSGVRVLEMAQEMFNQINEQNNLPPIDVVLPKGD